MNIEQVLYINPKLAEHNVYIFQVVPSIAANINVVLNEIMASNTFTAADDSGQYDDWIELYNLTSQPQDISGYYLSDNELNLTKWEIPAGTIIQPNDYLIIWADEDGDQGNLHANFKLSGSGEHLRLFNQALEIVAWVGKKGAHSMIHSIALNTYNGASGKIQLTRTCLGSCRYRIELRWTGEARKYGLQIRTRKDYGDPEVHYGITSLLPGTVNPALSDYKELKK